MKSFKKISISFDWRKLLAYLKDDQIALLNHPNGDFILGWQSHSILSLKQGNYDADEVENFLADNKSNYIFAYLSYDIKSKDTRVIGIKKDDRNFKDIHLFVSDNVLIKRGESHFYFGELSEFEVVKLIQEAERFESNAALESIELTAATNRNDYLNRIKRIKDHIQYGNIYEMNFCVNFKSEFEDFHPVQTYRKLVKNSEAPFSAFFRDDNYSILSASPERFIRQKNGDLMSQPIKGTAKRGETVVKDLQIIQSLKSDTKELAENVMIVDLVRNDFSKIATKNSVNVSELCKVYSFKTVHQLISTVNCKLKENTTFSNVLEATFPMGSMTGAPKISAMKIIDEFENFSRGIYSGAVGYFDPNGNYDFNVVIRSILADCIAKTVSCSVGGAITIQSNPEKEYEECLLKLSAIAKTLC